MTETKNHKPIREPLFHLAKRDNLPRHKALLIRLAAILVGMLIVCLFGLLIVGWDPFRIISTIFDGTFGTPNRRWDLFEKTAILLCISLAVTPAFRMRFWNIGAEGQTLIACLASVTCMLKIGDKVPNPVLLLIMVTASIIAGAVWAIIPAVFKAFWNTNETLFTLMMNYIATQITAYYVYIWSVPKGSGHIGIINANTKAGWLVSIGDYPYLLNILIVIVMTIVSYIYLNHCKHGYEISVVGESEKTARYIGINVKVVILRTMAISGAICGLAGFLIVAGADHTIIAGSVGGQGFTAIMVSWLAKFNPIAMAFFAFLIAFLGKGAKEITTLTGLDSSFADIVTGFVIFCIIGCEFFINFTIKFRKKEALPGAEAAKAEPVSENTEEQKDAVPETEEKNEEAIPDNDGKEGSEQ
ncbi:MAG: ABC transporter permease [Lachnospiraceae bacterium]|nr:ABC transporter permease [Lachnospiraceae bacterium]